MDEFSGFSLCIAEPPLTMDEIIEWFENVIFNGSLKEPLKNVSKTKSSKFADILSTRYTHPRDTSFVWAQLENEYSFKVFDSVRQWISNSLQN